MNEEPRPKTAARVWITRLAIAVLVYAASWGPIVASYDVGWLHNPAPQWLMTLYWPLDRMSEHPPTQRPMQLYYYAWTRHFRCF